MNTCSIQELIYFDPNRPSASFIKQILVAMLSVIVNNVTFNFIYNLIPKSNTLYNDTQQEYTTIQGKAVTPILFGISEIVNGGIYAPIVEELFFRFFVFKIVLIKICQMSEMHGNLLQSFIFGLMHMTNVITSSQTVNKTVLQTISSMIGGYLSGWTYIYTNSILTPIMAHMINNLIATGNEVFEYTLFYNSTNKT